MRVGVDERKLKARRASRARSATSALLLFAFCLLPLAFGQLLPARAQEVVDRMVAVINGRELITYSDPLWQLPPQPDAPPENPRQEDLRRPPDLPVAPRPTLQQAQQYPSPAPRE